MITEQQKQDLLLLSRNKYSDRYGLQLTDYYQHLITLTEYELNLSRYHLPINNSQILHNTPFLNYWMGIMAGDGSISSSKSPRISWATKDLDWLLSVVHYMNYPTEKIYSYKGEKYKNSSLYEINIQDLRIINYCVSHGMICRKSFIKESCIKADRGFEHYFIRGLFEADGHCKLGKQPTLYSSTWEIVNSEGQTHYIEGLLLNKGISCNLRNHSKHLKIISVSDPLSLKKLFEWIYFNELDTMTLNLSRKKNKCKKLWEVIKERSYLAPYKSISAQIDLNESMKADFISLDSQDFKKKYKCSHNIYKLIQIKHPNLFYQWKERKKVFYENLFYDSNFFSYIYGVFLLSPNYVISSVYHMWLLKLSTILKFPLSATTHSSYILTGNHQDFVIYMQNHKPINKDMVFKGFFDAHANIHFREIIRKDKTKPTKEIHGHLSLPCWRHPQRVKELLEEINLKLIPKYGEGYVTNSKTLIRNLLQKIYENPVKYFNEERYNDYKKFIKGE